MSREDYIRVTEIIKPFSGIEFVPDQFLNPAADRGTLVHNYIENKLAGFETPVENDKIIPYLESFDRFWNGSKHAFDDGRITLEKRLYCDEWKFSGKADLMAEVEGKTYIIDWKTSSRAQKSWRLQAAAYRYLAEVNGYENVDNLLFVKINKDGKMPTLYKYESYEEDLDIFFKCLELYRWFDMNKTRNQWNKYENK